MARVAVGPITDAADGGDVMNSLGVSRGASLWYPIMLAQECGEISEAKGAELLGMSVLQYREHKEQAIQAVMRLVNELKSPLASLIDAVMARPELFEKEGM